jgi:GMP synthase (glutamine-hydrolysing)
MPHPVAANTDCTNAMTGQSTTSKLLLLQIRDDPRVRVEERESFARFAGVPVAHVDVLNVFDTPQFDSEVVDDYDALLVGGASEASVLEPENYSFLGPSQALLRYCVEINKPVFASCFGFQLAVIAFGGRIVRDKDNFEMGTLPIDLTTAAATDPVFEGIPAGFHAVSVHKERATDLPAECELLAYTAACPHAFRISGKPFWAFQFHPELDRPTLMKRLTIFSSGYTDGGDHLREVLDSIVETPDSNRLVANFMSRVLGHN